MIFIGITASFLLQEWRQNQEKKERAIGIMKSMVVELERNDLFIKAIDTTYLNLNASIQKYIEDDKIQQAELVEIIYMTMEGTSQIRLKDISSFIHGFSSSDQLNILDRNKEILRYLSYIESLLTEHELITNSISEYSTLNLWPLIYKYDISDDVINYQSELSGLGKLSIKKSNNDFGEISKGGEFVQHLKWSQLKILRLIQINQAIHMQIENIIRELNIVIGRD